MLLVPHVPGSVWYVSRLWSAERALGRGATDAIERVLEFAAPPEVVLLNATVGEIAAVLHALDGGYVPAVREIPDATLRCGGRVQG